MILIVTLCAGILSAHPGCTLEEVPLLKEVTPQQCYLKAQEVFAKAQPRYSLNGYNVSAYGCRRRG
jgi:hypothetical protein